MAAAFPGAAEGTTLRTVADGVMEASSDAGNTMWYNSAYFDEPDAPHSIMQAANGVDWYAMQAHGVAPEFEQGEPALAYNQAQFQAFMPGYGQKVFSVDGTNREEGRVEVRHQDGSGTMFFDTAPWGLPGVRGRQRRAVVRGARRGSRGAQAGL